MELEVLLQAMKDAKAKADATPDDEALKAAAEEAEKAYNDAKAEADAKGDLDDFDESKADEKTKKYLKKLRDENAKHRTKNKELNSKFVTSEAQKKAILKAAGIEVEEEAPEEKLKLRESELQTKDFRVAILESALTHGIPKDQVDYYEFLITKATGELEEGEELEDDKLVEIVAKVKSAGGKKGNTTPGSKDGKGAPNPGGSGEGQMTLEKFCSLGIIEKSRLFEKSPAVYEEFVKQAKAKKKLV